MGEAETVLTRLKGVCTTSFEVVFTQEIEDLAIQKGGGTFSPFKGGGGGGGHETFYPVLDGGRGSKCFGHVISKFCSPPYSYN